MIIGPLKMTQATIVREPTPEELEEWAEMERQMENCPKKAEHEKVDEDGCDECGYGAK